MLKVEQVPDEVAKAVMHCFHTRNAAKSAIAAAINAWPGVCTCLGDDEYPRKLEPHDAIILPLPQEPRDE